MGASLKVWSFNLATGVDPGGFPWVDRALSRHIEEINERQPDIVGCQEVDRRTGRCNGMDQVALLQQATHLKYEVYAGRNFDGGKYGDVILSRWPAIAEIADHVVATTLPDARA